MRYIIVSLILFTSNFIFGQVGLTSYPIDISLDDTLEVKLIDIKNSKYKYYYRLLLNGQTIDLFSFDKKVFHCEITNSIKQYNQVKIEDEYYNKATKLFSEKVIIDSTTSTLVANKIFKSNQNLIPTDSLIKSWTGYYIHCSSLRFEIKAENIYIKQSFHCPWSQPDTVEFKDIILANYDLLKTELKLDSVYNVFFSKLPNGKTYSRNGYGMTYVFTEKQEESWKLDKPRRDYLKSIKDTIDNFLKAKLIVIQSESDSIIEPCYSAHLEFNTNGKLKKITTNKDNLTKLFDGFSWYIEDRVENFKCKKKIRRIFKQIDLSSFNLKHSIYRTFYRDLGNGWTVTDNTIY